MRAYFIRRLLLVPVTLLGITLVVFMVLRLAPGGPVERDLMEAALGGVTADDSGASGTEGGGHVPAAVVLEIQERYGEDTTPIVGWLTWLGVIKREQPETKARSDFEPGEYVTEITLPGGRGRVQVERDGSRARLLEISEENEDRQNWLIEATGERRFTVTRIIAGSESPAEEWNVRVESPGELSRRLRRAVRDHPEAESGALPWRAVAFQAKRSGLLQGDLGRSFRHGDPVTTMMRERIPISSFYGLTTMFLVYSICLPLGIVKALRHRTFLDSSSSIIVFMGYAVPGYALGALLLMVFSYNLGWFPLEGFTSENFHELGPFARVLDILHHAALPLACYLVSSFAFMTLLVKNNLMDNLAADYVRTAAAKGVPYRSAVFKHAFRNSIIPLATTFGNNVTLFVGGNFIIERVFDINGFGLLGFNAVLERDVPITMGVLFVAALLLLIGNIISDMLVALVDPRITFS